MPLISKQIHHLVTPRVRARFLRRLVADGNCLVFSGTKNARGYGIVDIMVQGKRHPTLAHRLAWVIANDRDILAGSIICHRCNNPSCCKPSHLYSGSHKTNARDMVQAGRHKASKPWLGVSGEAHPMAKYQDATRLTAISMRQRGMQYKKIAHALRVPQATIARWWREYVKAMANKPL